MQFTCIKFHSFASNGKLTFLESVEDGNYFPRKDVPDMRIDRSTCLRSRKLHATNRATAPGVKYKSYAFRAWLLHERSVIVSFQPHIRNGNIEEAPSTHTHTHTHTRARARTNTYTDMIKSYGYLKHSNTANFSIQLSTLCQHSNLI